MRKVLSMFGPLDDGDVDWLRRVGRQRRLVAGEVLIEAGDEATSFAVILEGALSVRARGAELASIGPGEIVGEMSLVDGRPASAQVAALGDVHVLSVPAREIRQRLASDLGFAARFHRAVALTLCDRLRAAQGEAEDELGPELLDTLHLAGERFARLVSHERSLSVTGHVPPA